MYPYIPLTDADQDRMLAEIGVNEISDLFVDIPEEIHLKSPLDLPPPLSEFEIKKELSELAKKNGDSESLITFRGAGAYDHIVPSVVSHIISRSEFYTAYTPYQPEISQGTLQYIFEYQSMMSGLLGMDVMNASLYDGATAAAEAALLASAHTRRSKIIISQGFDPRVIAVLKTYCRFCSLELKIIPLENGASNNELIKDEIDKETALVMIASPNRYGIVEDPDSGGSLAQAAHSAGALFAMSVDPISLGLLKPPAEFGADIAIGEAQTLGIPLSFGGPWLGFIGIAKPLMRRLPGRVVGETVDSKGKRAYVLTLQAREQHIRREKATSNICSNQSLCSLAAAVYLAALGKSGVREAAKQTQEKAAYCAQLLTNDGKFSLQFQAPFFREFLLAGNKDWDQINAQLEEKGFLGGLPIAKHNRLALGENAPLEQGCLIAVTEKRTRSEIEEFVKTVKSVSDSI